jgi:alanine dehydrogenase
MKVGTVTETKVEEYRVGLTPEGARALSDAGHEALVQHGAVPRTSTEAVASATLPYVLQLAGRGLAALRENAGLATGASAIHGKLVSKPVAEAQGLPDRPLSQAL